MIPDIRKTLTWRRPTMRFESTMTVLIVFLFAGIFFCVGVLTWPYAINTFITTFTTKQAVFPWWVGGFMGLVPGLCQLGAIMALLMWIISACI